MRRMSFMPDLARFLGILVACLLWPASAGAQSSAPAESVSDIEIEAPRDASFEKLPEAIQPNVMRMHAPSYILTMYDGSKRHKVWLYEPEKVTDPALLKRFFTVWNAAWALVPLRPRDPPSASPSMAAPDARR